MMELSETLSLTDDAACKDKDVGMFFVDEGPISDVYVRNAISRAVALCNLCPVQDKCLMIAVNNGEEFGIWGGFTSRERRKLFGKKGKSKQDIDIDEARELVLWKRSL
jgi:WhiB family redox-sensing transcriptional regulator